MNEPQLTKSRLEVDSSDSSATCLPLLSRAVGQRRESELPLLRPLQPEDLVVNTTALRWHSGKLGNIFPFASFSFSVAKGKFYQLPNTGYYLLTEPAQAPGSEPRAGIPSNQFNIHFVARLTGLTVYLWQTIWVFQLW